MTSVPSSNNLGRREERDRVRKEVQRHNEHTAANGTAPSVSSSRHGVS